MHSVQRFSRRRLRCLLKALRSWMLLSSCYTTKGLLCHLLGWFQPSWTHGSFHMYLFSCWPLLLFTALHFKSNLNLIKVPTLNGFLPEIYKLTLSLLLLVVQCYLLVSELHGSSGKIWHRSLLARLFTYILKYSFLGKYQQSHWEQHPGQGSFLHPTWRYILPLQYGQLLWALWIFYH